MAEHKLANYFVSTLGEAQQRCEFLTINDLLDEASNQRPDYPAVGFPVPSAEGDWSSEIFSFEELRDGSSAFAATLPEMLKPEVQSCIALLCPSNMDFLFAWLALIRAGYSVLLIAPQCQPEGIASLCRDCGASTILYSENYHDLATLAMEASENLRGIMLAWHLSKAKVISMILQAGQRQFSSILTPKITPKSIAYIHHTSGTSTGFPKPIPQTHHGAVGVLPCLVPRFKATFTTTPLYHGGIADCFRAWCSSELIWLFPGGDVPITERNICSSLRATKSTVFSLQCSLKEGWHVKYFASVPYILQMLASHEEGLRWLQGMDVVGAGGAALPQEVGDTLVKQGVNLVSRFGSAECGFLLSSYRDFKNDLEWQYLRPPKPSRFLRFEMQDDNSGLAELVVLKGWPHMAKTNRPDGSFATGDLFMPHRSAEGRWKYHSRSEGLIALTTGKKFDPAPIEDDLIASAPGIIKEALVFGAGRQVPGVLIFVNKDASHKEDVSKQGYAGRLIDLVHHDMDEQVIWTAIFNANLKGESHARIERHMVIVFVYDHRQPLKRSSKGTLIRKVAEERFAKAIENAYHYAVSDGGSPWLSKKATPKAKIKAIIEEVLGTTLDDDQNFFDNGVDSQKSTRIRNLLQDCFGEKLPWNVVYDCGSIDNLVLYFKSTAQGSDVRETAKGFGEAKMLQMVEKFSNWPAVDTGSSQQGQQVVILTGATGALGAHILQALFSTKNVFQICCLVRAESDIKAQERVLQNLDARKIDYKENVDLLPNLRCFASSLHETDLGLDEATYSYLEEHVSLIIHAAWPVNFLLPLSSFEFSLLGLSNLLSLTQSNINIPPKLRPHPKFVFCSSTASNYSNPSYPVPEAISTSPGDASPVGYSQSKWVAESICSRHQDCPVKIIRIGQLTGDTKHGIWNMSEAYPTILSSVRELKCLPAIPDLLHWLPMDTAAKAIVEIALSKSDYKALNHFGADGEPGAADGVEVYHVINEYAKPSFTDLLYWLKDSKWLEDIGDPELRFEIVEPEVWMDRIETLETGHPLKALLGFWRQIYGSKGELEVNNDEDKMEAGSFKGHRDDDALETSCHFQTKEAEKVSEVMRNVKPVDRELMGKIWGWLKTEMDGGSVGGAGR